MIISCFFFFCMEIFIAIIGNSIGQPEVFAFAKCLYYKLLVGKSHFLPCKYLFESLFLTKIILQTTGLACVSKKKKGQKAQNSMFSLFQ